MLTHPEMMVICSPSGFANNNRLADDLSLESLMDTTNQEVLRLSSYVLVNDECTELTRTKGFASFVRKLCPQYVVTDQNAGKLYCEYNARVDFAITRMNKSFGFFYADSTTVVDEELVDDRIIATMMDEYKLDTLHVPQSLAGMLSVTANNAVKYLIAMRQPVDTIISHGVCVRWTYQIKRC